jgi:hypothetical protein
MQSQRVRKKASTLDARRKEERLERALQSDIRYLKAEAEEERRERAEASAERGG